MNRYLKEFLHRGLIFAGFGPIVVGIVFFVLSLTLEDFSLGGTEVLLAIVSTYILAFLQAGTSVFNQIEHWSLTRSLLAHFSILYVAYVGCYVANSWIPFEWLAVGIFTAIFVVAYLVIWCTVYICIKLTSKRLNANLR